MPKDKNTDLLLYGISVILALIIHYLALSRITMHSTLHALLGIALLYLVMVVTVFLFHRKNKRRKKNAKR